MGKLKKALKQVQIDEVQVELDLKEFLASNVEIEDISPLKETKPLKTRKTRIRKSKKTSKNIGVFTSFFSKMSNLFEFHKRILATGALVVFAITIVSITSYAAYSGINMSNKDILGKVGTHVILPAGTPKVYIVQSDQSEFLKNPIFSDVRLGDNILNYEEVGKVIIYRSKEDRVVNIVNTK